MSRFVAFLRGINVGSHIVTKEQLKEAFASLGFHNVSTFGQSGNVIFEISNLAPEELITKIENKLRTILGYEVSVFVRTISKLKLVIQRNPLKDPVEGTNSLVTFLSITPVKLTFKLPLVIPKSTAQILIIRDSEVYSATHGGGEGALPNPFIESELKIKATTRNIKTIRRIVEKYDLPD